MTPMLMRLMLREVKQTDVRICAAIDIGPLIMVGLPERIHIGRWKRVKWPGDTPSIHTPLTASLRCTMMELLPLSYLIRFSGVTFGAWHALPFLWFSESS
jgi:hypothetical protein